MPIHGLPMQASGKITQNSTRLWKISRSIAEPGKAQERGQAKHCLYSDQSSEGSTRHVALIPDRICLRRLLR